MTNHVTLWKKWYII